MSTLPLSGTNIRLMSGIPFSNDYKHTRWFDSMSEQQNWFGSQTVVYSKTDHNFQKIDGHLYVDVNMNIDQLWSVNYLSFVNKFQGISFYAFVTKLEYIQGNTTRVHFQIDVLQTWMFYLNWKPSFVVREHCEQYNGDGTPVINTIDEGLNYGSEYDIVDTIQVKPYSDIFFMVVVAKSALHDSNNIDPVLNGVPQPLSYYVHPFKLDGSVPNIMIGTNGLNTSSIIDVLKGLMTQTKSVDDVVSIYVTEYIGYNASYDGSLITFDSNRFQAVQVGSINTIYVSSLPNYIPLNINFGNKYTNYRSVKETKLLMYPYTVLTMDDFKGNRIDIKNEYINSSDISIDIKGSIGTSNKVAYSIDNYLQPNTWTYSTITAMEHAVINNNANDIPILNSMLAAYLQGHKNTIANQKASANFNGIMSIMSSFVNAGGAVAGGIASGNPASAVLGATQSVLGGIQGAGNSVLQLQAINAKQKDIANVPPSLQSMGSNSNFDYGNYIYGMYLIKKQIKPEYQKKLEDFFNMYGYKRNEVKYPNFHTRQNWNYVQTQNCVIRANLNNEDLQEIKNIFDGGITLWHTDDIGNYTLANGVI